MVEFSCADFTFPVLSHKKALQLIALMDFKWVDVGLFQDRSHIQPSDQFDKPEYRGKILRDLTGGFGLQISDIFLQAALDFTNYAINNPNDAIRKELRGMFERAIEYASAAGCKHLSGLPGVEFSRPGSHALCVDELYWRVERAKKAGITFSVEPHLGSIMSTPEDALVLLKEVPGLSIVLDHSHYTAQGIDMERVRPLTAYATHIHVRGAAKGKMQTSVACNETDFAQVASDIKENGYAGIICMEYTYVDWENCNCTDNVSETLLLRERLSKLMNV